MYVYIKEREIRCKKYIYMKNIVYMIKAGLVCAAVSNDQRTVDMIMKIM